MLNGGTAETIFGTPFGNVPRNLSQDAISNIANVSIGKRIKLSERSSFEFRTSFVNVFNHPNFASIDPFLEDAGAARAPGTGFGDPTLTNDVPATITFPVSASRRIVLCGTIRS